jgi:uncharacterized membrane protein
MENSGLNATSRILKKHRQQLESKMTSNLIVYASLLVGFSSALVAGVFQSFSDFVMKALVAAQPASGIEPMQMINRTVFRSVFLLLFLGLAPVTLAFAAYAFFKLSGAAQIWIISGTLIYLISVFLVTLFGNVPMNKRLDRMEQAKPEAASYWKIYGQVWTGWNHLRTFGSATTSICFLLASIALV